MPLFVLCINFADTTAAIQYNNFKYMVNENVSDVIDPLYEWNKDLSPENSFMLCQNASLIDDTIYSSPSKGFYV